MIQLIVQKPSEMMSFTSLCSTCKLNMGTWLYCCKPQPDQGCFALAEKSPEADERGASADREEASAISKNPLELSGHFDSKSPHTITSGLLCHSGTKPEKSASFFRPYAQDDFSRQDGGLLYRGGTKR
jgi:hypothetical protein